MTIKELKQNAPKSKAFREVLEAIRHKPYVSEDALISEEAEKLFKQYQYVYSKVKTPEYAQKSFFIKLCILPSYRTFNEVADEIRSIVGNSKLSDIEIKELYKYSNKCKGTKYSTFKEALEFLKLSNK